MTRGPQKGSGEGALVSHRCHLQMLDLINRLLGSENRGRLMESQFGFLFSFPSLQFQGQIFNILLRHLDKTSLQRNRLEFIFRGQRMEFSPQDFVLITGMNFSGWYEPPLESETHRLLFNGKQSISVDDIAMRFKTECAEQGGSTLNALRLACLLILYGIFVTMGGTVNHVDLNLFHLVDDVGSFLRYPWGLISYNTLVKRTHRARDVKEKQNPKDKRVAFDANSFVLALQVWVYEVIPMVGRNCAFKEPRTAHIFPRVLRWETSVSIKYDVLQTYFSSLNAESLTPMVPSDVESDFLTPLGFKRKDTATVIEANSDDESTKEPTKVQSEDDDKVSQMMTRLDVLEKVVNSLEAKIATIGSPSEMRANNKRPLQTTDKLDAEGPKKSKVMRPDAVPCCRRTDLRSQSYISGDASTNAHDVVHTRKGKSIVHDTEHYLETESVERSCSDKLKKTSYDPNEMSLDPGVTKGFDAWRAAAKQDSSLGLKIPCLMVGDVGGKWFDSLCSRRGWLNTSHMNALINLLMLQSKSEPQLFTRGWTAMETFCWDVLCGRNLAIVMERVGPYVKGEKPSNNPIPLAVASNVYGIGHVDGNHWVSYRIALDERCITVFDSRSMTSSWLPVKNLFKDVVKNVELLCVGFEVFKDRVSENDNKWKVVLHKHPPQQHGHFDCGVLAMKYIECLVSGNSVGIIDATRCGFFRRSYCAKLFQVSSVIRGNEIGL